MGKGRIDGQGLFGRLGNGRRSLNPHDSLSRLIDLTTDKRRIPGRFGQILKSPKTIVAFALSNELISQFRYISAGIMSKLQFKDIPTYFSINSSQNVPVSPTSSSSDGEVPSKTPDAKIPDKNTEPKKKLEATEGEEPNNENEKDKNKVPILSSRFEIENMEGRTKYLVGTVKKFTGVSSAHNLSHHVEDLFSHLYQHVELRNWAVEAGAVSALNKVIKTHPGDEDLVNRARETLAILGQNPPIKGNGIKILSIDGGGVRGLVALEVLRVLEKMTGKKIHELFDYICGVSTGSILAFLVGGQRRSVDECETLYKELSLEIFGGQNRMLGAGNLLWRHGYYSTAGWEKILKKNLGQTPLISLARDPQLPRVSAISMVVNQEQVVPYVFRSYSFPPGQRPRYIGGCRYDMWEACRASAAAPTYFEEFKLGSYLHQDGGVLVNNPTSVALTEARTLWPNTPLQCVVSVGTGMTMSSRSELRDENVETIGPSSTSWKSKFLKVLDSATDTESIHNTMSELLPTGVYFRFNPYLSEMVTLDESRAEKLDAVQTDTREYLKRNFAKVSFVSSVLLKEKGLSKKVMDWWNSNL